jgi:Geminivirus Rep catalytic domain
LEQLMAESKQVGVRKSRVGASKPLKKAGAKGLRAKRPVGSLKPKKAVASAPKARAAPRRKPVGSDSKTRESEEADEGLARVDSGGPVRRWAVTWANCELTKQALLELLQKRFSLREYLIAVEVAPTTAKPHLHAYLRLLTKVRWNKDLFNVKVNGKVYKANLKPAYDYRNWINYCLKRGDYITNMESVDPAVYRARRFDVVSKTDPVELAKRGVIDWKDVDRVIKLQETLSLMNPDELNVVHKTIYDEGKRHHWFIVGSPDDGKTALLAEIEKGFRELEKAHDLPTGTLVFRWAKNGDQKGYRGAPLIIWDEVTAVQGDKNRAIGEMLALLSGGDKANTKGGTVRLAPVVAFIMASNLRLNEVFYESPPRLDPRWASDEERWDVSVRKGITAKLMEPLRSRVHEGSLAELKDSLQEFVEKVRTSMRAF